jgi:lysozyme
MNNPTDYTQHHHHHHHHHHRSALRKWGNRLLVAFAVVALAVLLLAFFSPDTLGKLSATFQRTLNNGVDLLTTNNRHLRVDYDGIDVSHYQGVIDWYRVGEDADVKFVYIKATEGSDHADSLYERNLQGAIGAEIPVGSYHYLTSSSPVAAQFKFFASVADRSLQRLRPMVDIEADGVKGWSSQQIADSLAAFADMVKRHYHVWPVIYSYSAFYNAHLAPRFNNFHLFLARYDAKEPVVHGAGKHSIWQHTDMGAIDGIPKPVDLDVFAKGTTLADILIPDEVKD